MPKMRFSAEQIVAPVCKIEITMGAGKSTQIAWREAGISEQSSYRWRKEYGGLDLDPARRMKDLESVNFPQLNPPPDFRSESLLILF